MANPEHLKIVLEGKSRDFSGFDLSEVDLANADLANADLYSADLSSADLSRANLSRANLARANLSSADLLGANLSRVELFRAILSRANLRGANLSKSSMAYTVLSDPHGLGEAKGLRTVHHARPSEIGIRTLLTTKLPDVFLRGCGVPEELITFLPSLRNSVSAIDFYSCFISYSHADKSFARRLHDALQGRGIRCWLDEHQLLPGDKVQKSIDDAIRIWDKVLLCSSVNSLKNSWWVENEIETAFAKEAQLRKKGSNALALIPLNLDGFLFSDECTLGSATQIKTRLAADFQGWESDNDKFEEQFEKLVKALRADAGGREAPPTPKLK